MEQLEQEEALEILSEADVAHIGMVVDGKPYVTPMSFVLDGDHVLFRTMPGRKLRALRANGDVCIEVSSFDSETGDWASVIVTGNARETEDHKTGERAIHLLLDKYRDSIGSPLRPGGLQPLEGLPHVIQVEIESVSGFCSGRAFSRRTRPGRL